MLTLIVLGILLFWVIPGFVAACVWYAFAQRMFSSTRAFDRTADTIGSMGFAVLGIFGLIMAAYMTGGFECGFKIPGTR